MKQKKILIIHPFLFAVFPIIFLYAHNFNYVPYKDVIFPLVVSLLSCCFLLVTIRLFSKSFQSSAFTVLSIIFLFFSYGRIYKLLDRFFCIEAIRLQFSNLVIGPNKVLLLIIFVLIMLVFITVRRKQNLNAITKWFNVISIVLLIMPSINITKDAVVLVLNQQKHEESLNDENATELDRKTPNIIYIILDGYTRNDILKEVFNYDNTEFLNFLKSRGFFVGEQSYSNYIQTVLSLCSSFNFNYLDEYIPDDLKNTDKRKFLCNNNLKNNNVISTLKKHGYKFISFDSGYQLTNFDNADLFVKQFNSSAFANMILSQTFLPLINKTYYVWRKRIVFNLQYLSELKNIPDKYFLFAHIIAPHPPFLWNADGQTDMLNERFFTYVDGSHYFKEKGATKEEYKKGYINNLKYINSEIMKAIDNILSSDTGKNTIIIIQGDHGSGVGLDWESFENSDTKERTAILNAYHIPNLPQGKLYDSISPVNTFRVIFNHIFDENYEMLPDKSFYSKWKKPYQFIPVIHDKNM